MTLQCPPKRTMYTRDIAMAVQVYHVHTRQWRHDKARGNRTRWIDSLYGGFWWGAALCKRLATRWWWVIPMASQVHQHYFHTVAWVHCGFSKVGQIRRFYNQQLLELSSSTAIVIFSVYLMDVAYSLLCLLDKCLHSSFTATEPPHICCHWHVLGETEYPWVCPEYHNVDSLKHAH